MSKIVELVLLFQINSSDALYRAEAELSHSEFMDFLGIVCEDD